ncbi:MAG: FAD-dependent oxidoreductase, partial [Fuscovulum sp.]|nr:FAD-dependent oxidoreductase [Fuscovulum sp.]
PVITSNRINTPEVAERLLAEGMADMVSMARPWLADADFIAKAAAGRARDIAPCIACNQACLDHTFSGKLTSCLVNPRAAHESELTLAPAPSPKRIAVVGAGPAGMAAAITAAQRGHQVTLFEASGRPGGQLHLAATIPGKEEFRGLIDWFTGQLAHPGITLRLMTRATEESLKGYDEVILATGVTPRDPGIPTAPGAQVLSYLQVLQGAPVGPRVAIVGAGGIGFDVAEFLVHRGDSPTEHPDLWRREWGVGDPAQTRGGLAPPRPEPPARQVWLLQRKPEKPGRSLGKTTGWIHRAQLAAKGVRMIGGVNYEAIDEKGLHITHGPGRTEAEVVAVDTVVLCAGQDPARALSQGLTAAGVSHHLIGGADVAAELDAKRAIDQATRLAARL